MLTLGIDSSAVAASAALVEDGKLLGEFYCNTKQVHSQTLLPMVEGLLQTVGRSCGELDAIAVSHGPGSFTGVRIGVSCVKGIALPKNIPCVGVSTLEAIAYSGIPYEDAILCAVMDARCGQVYNALFRSEGGALHRLTEDRACPSRSWRASCGPMAGRSSCWGTGRPCATRRSPCGAPAWPQRASGTSGPPLWRCWGNRPLKRAKPSPPGSWHLCTCACPRRSGS